MQAIIEFLKENEYEITVSEINSLSIETKNSSVNCGKSYGNKIELSKKSWDLLDEFSQEIWESDLPLETKVKLGFEFYDLFPHYYHFLYPFYALFETKKLEDHPSLKEVVWSKFMTYLASENYYQHTVTYILWVEFFEDYIVVEEAWKGLINYSENIKALLVLIENAGPVPFDLKEPVYNKLIEDESNHYSIFKSLLHSTFDVYGDVNCSKAQAILAQLTVEKDTEEYQLLMDKIKK